MERKENNDIKSSEGGERKRKVNIGVGKHGGETGQTETALECGMDRQRQK